jgi:hypothetical protein
VAGVPGIDKATDGVGTHWTPSDPGQASGMPDLRARYVEGGADRSEMAVLPVGLLASSCKTVRMKYVTGLDRFVAGDYPMVCARSGRPATRVLPVQAWRSSLLGPPLISGGWVGQAKFLDNPAHPWGLLPFADGQKYRGAAARYKPSVGIILRGVHPAFVDAARQSEGETSQ